MVLTKHITSDGERWALNGCYLSSEIRLDELLKLKQTELLAQLAQADMGDSAESPLLPPIEAMQEVWACGVTYLRSREARELESDTKDVYEKVYKAERPELFFKANGWRVVGHNMPVRIRRDSGWNVPEPELTLVINSHREIVGFCVGNDMSSRDIEGANPLYLPQAKMYDGACAIGPGIEIVRADDLRDINIDLDVLREGKNVYHGETRSSQMKRSLEELVEFLTREMDFPYGAFLMTGTGIVPDDSFTLQVDDLVRICIGSLTLENVVNS